MRYLINVLYMYRDTRAITETGAKKNWPASREEELWITSLRTHESKGAVAVVVAVVVVGVVELRSRHFSGEIDEVASFQWRDRTN